MLVISLAVANVVIDDVRKFFRSWRETLLISLFHLEQRSTAKCNCCGFVARLSRAPQIFFHEGNSDACVADAEALENRQPAIFKIASAVHPRCPWKSVSNLDGMKAFQKLDRQPTWASSNSLKYLAKLSDRGSACTCQLLNFDSDNNGLHGQKLNVNLLSTTLRFLRSRTQQLSFVFARCLALGLREALMRFRSKLVVRAP